MPDMIYAMGSRNHSYLQARLSITLGNLEKYTVFTELSLDIETEYDIKEPRPDVCLYPKLKHWDPVNDVLKMSEMPLLASPEINFRAIS